MQRTISLILCMLMLLSSVSCSNNSAQETAGTAASADTAEETTDSESADPNLAYYDALPTGDYDGRTFTILTTAHTENDFVGEVTGEVVEDAVANRNIVVEEKLNITFNIVPEAGAWSDRETFNAKITDSVMAGDYVYDLVSGYGASITLLAPDNVLANWNEVSTMNLSSPWWNQDIVDEMSVNNRLYFITGDLSMTSINYLFSLFFNKELMTDLGLDMPYSLVLDGKWTFDKLKEYASACENDVNGDGEMTEVDLYGYVTDTSNMVNAYQPAFNVKVTEKDADGIPQLAVMEEAFTTKFQALYSFVRESTYVYATGEGPYNDDLNSESTQIFMAGRALFVADLLGNASVLRTMETDFGIVPYPKYDEAQANYQTTTWDAANLFCIPLTADLDFTGVVTDNMGAYSEQYVTPALYDKALLSKYTRDDESSEMITIIHNGAVYNFGIVNALALNSVGTLYRNMINDCNPNMASKLKNTYKAYAKQLKAYVENTYFDD